MSSLQLSNTIGVLVNDVVLYRSIVGALQYDTFIRPGISFAMNKANPLNNHWTVTKYILRYLARSLNLEFHYLSMDFLMLIGMAIWTLEDQP